MSIEIKSRYGGKVLYVAEDATDVKTAVEEAVRARANLAGAYLDGAYLNGAHLADAYLNGANLNGANLADANLADAYLTGAYLNGANLNGANLARANLDGAYLPGAHLADGVWAEVAKVLTSALAKMNDSGKHWIKHSLEETLEDGSKAYCSIGGVNAACDDGTVRAIALWLLAQVTAGSMANFNDHADTDWDDIQAVFGIAVKHAQRFAKDKA